MKLLLTCILLVESAARGFGQAPAKVEVAPDTLITLQRGACEGRCAVYRLIIFADGTVIYEGRFNVKKTGLVKSGISPEVLSQLIADLAAGGFFQLENKYGFGDTSQCKSVTAGEPTAILSVANKGRAKTVLHEHGCSGEVSDRITELEDKVDRAVGTVHWIR